MAKQANQKKKKSGKDTEEKEGSLSLGRFHIPIKTPFLLFFFPKDIDLHKFNMLT